MSRGLLEAFHGAGEALRGTVNYELDSFGDVYVFFSLLPRLPREPLLTFLGGVKGFREGQAAKQTPNRRGYRRRLLPSKGLRNGGTESRPCGAATRGPPTRCRLREGWSRRTWGLGGEEISGDFFCCSFKCLHVIEISIVNSSARCCSTPPASTCQPDSSCPIAPPCGPNAAIRTRDRLCWGNIREVNMWMEQRRREGVRSASLWRKGGGGQRSRAGGLVGSSTWR